MYIWCYLIVYHTLSFSCRCSTVTTHCILFLLQEFRILFLVLQSNDPWIILGLDQMQRFKCIIDLERHVMLFGGREGVEVPFLDQELAGEAARKKTTASTDPLPAMDDTESATMVLPAAPATASRAPTTSGSGNTTSGSGNTTPTKRWGFRNLMRKPSS